MEYTLTVGVILGLGFLLGTLAEKFYLPRITGYILAGILLKLDAIPLLPPDFLEHTGFITNIALAFITFSVGGSLVFSNFKKLGRALAFITIFEASLAVIFVISGFALITYLFPALVPTAWVGMAVPISILLGTFATPTDPATTLAVSHEFRAKGNVSSGILGIAALDDALGVIIFSVGVSLAEISILNKDFNFQSSLLLPLYEIGGGICIGVCFALLFNKISSLLTRTTKGSYIVLILGLITICYSVAEMLGTDELLATMAMGCMVSNFNPQQKSFFEMLEHYLEELIFVLFFTISGMYFDIQAISQCYVYILIFVLLRSSGKLLGARTGAILGRAPQNVINYTGMGLIPQGGIVIGLALLIQDNPAFSEISEAIINIVIGATVVHELIGPISVKVGLQKAGEILASQKEGAFVRESGEAWDAMQEKEGQAIVDILANYTVSDLYDKVDKVETVPRGIKFSQFKKLFLSTTQDYFPLVGPQGELEGIFSSHDFRGILMEPEIDDLIVVDDIATTEIITTTLDEDLSTVMQKFTSMDPESMPVVANDGSNKFLGMLGRKALIEFYNQKVQQLRSEQNHKVPGQEET